jgi:dUTP pyrophosphatase
MIIKFKGNMPTQMTSGSAGFDLYANKIERDNGLTTIHTGTYMQIPKGYVGLLALRSSMIKKGYRLANGIGVIDSDYTDEILVKLDWKNVPINSEIHVNDRIAQLVITKHEVPTFVLVEELDKADRLGGFGSTGE